LGDDDYQTDTCDQDFTSLFTDLKEEIQRNSDSLRKALDNLSKSLDRLGKAVTKMRESVDSLSERVAEMSTKAVYESRDESGNLSVLPRRRR
jgi:methyl-accepting chemotaxis protein